MRSFDGFSVTDLEYADTVDPAGISTWSNTVDGLSKFRDKGGKVITFHGTLDSVCYPVESLVPRYSLIRVFFPVTGDTIWPFKGIP